MTSPLIFQVTLGNDSQDADLDLMFYRAGILQNKLDKFLRGEISGEELDQTIYESGLNPEDIFNIFEDNING